MDATHRAIVNVWHLYYERDKNLALTDPRVTVCRGLASWLSEDKDGLLAAVDWARQTIVPFNYDDFMASCTFSDIPGALRDELSLGHVMVVESALRDEGTSFHYATPSRTIRADALGIEVLDAVLGEHGVGHFTGRTWTTDAFFRETRSRIQRRIDEGCSMVDMESSAFIAVARYYGLRFAQLLYAGDSVAGDDWDSRQWDTASDMRRRLFLLAAEAAWALHQH